MPADPIAEQVAGDEHAVGLVRRVRGRVPERRGPTGVRVRPVAAHEPLPGAHGVRVDRRDRLPQPELVADLLQPAPVPALVDARDRAVTALLERAVRVAVAHGAVGVEEREPRDPVLVAAGVGDLRVLDRALDHEVAPVAVEPVLRQHGRPTLGHGARRDLGGAQRLGVHLPVDLDQLRRIDRALRGRPAHVLGEVLGLGVLLTRQVPDAVAVLVDQRDDHVRTGEVELDPEVVALDRLVDRVHGELARVHGNDVESRRGSRGRGDEQEGESEDAESRGSHVRESVGEGPRTNQCSLTGNFPALLRESRPRCTLQAWGNIRGGLRNRDLRS